MDIALALLGLGLAIAIGVVLWRRRRDRRLEVTAHDVLCPMHQVRAHVAVTTNPDAPSSHRYVGVRRCSLHSDMALGLPERTAYLPEAPMYKVRMEPAPSGTVYTADVACSEHCLFVLNHTAVAGPIQPVECTSGACDAMDLARQATGSPRTAQLLAYFGS